MSDSDSICCLQLLLNCVKKLLLQVIKSLQPSERSRADMLINLQPPYTSDWLVRTQHSSLLCGRHQDYYASSLILCVMKTSVFDFVCAVFAVQVSRFIGKRQCNHYLLLYSSSNLTDILLFHVLYKGCWCCEGWLLDFGVVQQRANACVQEDVQWNIDHFLCSPSVLGKDCYQRWKQRGSMFSEMSTLTQWYLKLKHKSLNLFSTKLSCVSLVPMLFL